ncbi:hypothetical protein LCGC14_1287050 [marine sediment metagenome]|uniref:Uncharacterized protein n=1 Tax=marine sediment metagenome TaxID=412755 RepID=A0A0F9KVA8_9ZZZZ
MGQYPRLLNLDEATEQSLITYLNDEMVRHDMERQDAIQVLLDQQKDYWAEPSLKQRKFPFLGASNLVIPLNAIAAESVQARVMTTMWASTPVVVVNIRNPEFAAAEHPLENYLDYELRYNMRARDMMNSSCFETVKYGTGIGKSDYLKLVKKAVRYNAAGEREEFPVVIRDGATMDSVAYANFIMPNHAQNPQTAPWCGELMTNTPFGVKNLEESKLFYPGTFERLTSFFRSRSRQGTTGERKFTAAQEDLEKTAAIFPEMIDFRLIYLSFDVDGDDKLEEIVVWYHHDSLSLMGARYNWNDDLRRPYRIVQYIPIEHRWRGLGVSKQNSQFQREVTTIHRQRLDNATIANMRMFKINRMSGYGPKEPIFPGKMWFLDDMTHVDTIQLGEVYTSSFSNEQSAVLYSQQRTGVNEVILGMPQVGTPGTATGDLARIQEGNKKFDFSMDNIRDWFSILTMDGLLNIKQFGPRHPGYFDHAEGGAEVLKILGQSISDIRKGILFEVKAAGQAQNRLLDRNNWQQIGALTNQYYVAMIQLAMQAGRQDLVSLILDKGLVAATEVMKQILESFDVRSINRILVTEVEELLGQAKLLPPGSQPDSLEGADRGTQDINKAQRLATIQRIITGNGDGSELPAEVSERLGGL